MVAHQLCVVQTHQHAIVIVEIAQPIGNLDVLLHRAAEHANFAIELLRDVKNDLKAMN